MAYKHGAYVSEQATSLTPMTQTDSGLIVAFGTAPIHLAKKSVGANTPVLCYTYQAAVANLGYASDFENYTLCEVMKAQFALFYMSPVIFVNVLDPKKHKEDVNDQRVSMKDGVCTFTEPILKETLKAKAGAELLTIEKDYTASYDSAGELLITALKGGKLTEKSAGITVSCTKLNPSLVTAKDIVGGIHPETNRAEGLELIDEIFPRFGIVPGILIAPKWSEDVSVSAVLRAKAENISGHFSAIALCDIPTKEVKSYTDAGKWKNEKSFADKNCVLCWPLLKQGEDAFHLSTQLASVMNHTDSQHDDIPYYSPSNKSLKTEGTVLEDGAEIYLNSAQASYLNRQGIVTAINFIGGWKSWGNRTTAYPSNLDAKDNFIAIRRMFNWIGNTLVTSFWAKIDDPANKRLIEMIVDSANIWLNGLTAKGALLGGRVEFREDENPTTELMDGILRFHVFITPPSPAREIDLVQEYDPEYISALFA